MPGGGLVQMVAQGAQDVYLVNGISAADKEASGKFYSHWALVYQRHNNFACEDIRQTSNGSGGYGGRETVIVTRNGDLLSKFTLQITFPAILTTDELRYVDNPALAFIDHIDLEIGGQKIDTIYGRYMDIYQDLEYGEGKRNGIRYMQGATTGGCTDPGTCFVDVPFYFSKRSGLALPLIALQYHEVRFVIEYADVDEVLRADNPAHTNKTLTTSVNQYGDYLSDATTIVGKYQKASSSSFDLTKYKPSVEYFCNYVFLDTDERREFASKKHEYLIEQVQFTGSTTWTNASNPNQIDMRIHFNHPVKELLVQCPTTSDKIKYGGISAFQRSISNDAGAQAWEEPVNEMLLQINGHERQSIRQNKYYSQFTPFRAHKAVPKTNDVMCFAFGLEPFSYQPTGTLNFSRVDNATLRLTRHETIAATDVVTAERTVYAGAAKVGTTDAAFQSITLSAASTQGFENVVSVGTEAASSRDVFVYALSYNVLRIQGGMGGALFAN